MKKNNKNIIAFNEKDEIKLLINEEKLDHILEWIDKSENVDLYDEYEK